MARVSRNCILAPDENVSRWRAARLLSHRETLHSFGRDCLEGAATLAWVLATSVRKENPVCVSH
jgi:hypothetical protein